MILVSAYSRRDGMSKEQSKEFEPISEEELIELVLEAQQEALAKEREERLAGIPKTKKKSRSVRLILWIIITIFSLSSLTIIFEVLPIPAFEFIKTSTKLSNQEDIQNYKLAVVEIKTNEGKGTGFSISQDGYIITNEHVIDHALTVTVSFPEAGIFKSEVVASYPDIDLAILKVDSEDESVPYLNLASSYNLTENEHIYFIGNPLSFSGIANEGEIIDYTTLSDWDEQVIMLDAPVYRGNSGSPVINKSGDVIGVIFATTKNKDHGRVGLFVPIQLIQEKLKEL